MKRKYPFVRQEENKDCGVACLAMIIKYYKGNILLNELKEKSITTKKGTNAYNLLMCASEIGFDTSGIKCDIETLGKVIMPCIAHVVIDNKYKHYIVIYEIDYKQKKLLIGDPSSSIKKISFEEFFSIWDGVILTLIPNRVLPYNSENNYLKELMHSIISHNKKDIIDITILSLFVTIFGIATTFFFQIMIDAVNNQKKINYITLIFIIFIILELSKNISQFFRNKVLIYVNQKMDIILTFDTFKNIILLPYHYFSNHTTGEVVSKMSDLGIVRNTISKIFVIIFIDFFLALISFIILLAFNKTLSLIAFIIFLLYILNVLLFHPFLKKYIESMQVLKADATSYMVEAISSYTSVKGNNIEKNIIDKFQYKYSNLLTKIFKFDKLYNVEIFLKDTISQLGFLVIIFSGILLVTKGQMTIGSLITFNMLFGYFLDPIKNIIELDNNIKESYSALKRISNLKYYNKNKKVLDLNIQGNIKVNNLTFSYDNNKNVLKNISMTFDDRNTLIIGSSGTGKSTLFKLLMKYYKISNNKILIGGIDINDITDDSLKKHITYLSQKESIFTDTLYNNIVMERDISDDEFLKVIRTCSIEPILNSNLGYNMILEEGGQNLSGGERERIFLARALLSNSKYLIIDEGMAEMDIGLERKILKNIIKNYNKTIIMISHRFDNADLFKRVIKLEEGELVLDADKPK